MTNILKQNNSFILVFFYEYTRWLLFFDDVIVSKELYGQKAQTFIIQNDLESDNIGPKKLIKR